MNFVSERVAAHKRIRRVEFVDEIPESPAGKIAPAARATRPRTRAARLK